MRGLTFNGLYHDVTPHSVNYVRSAVLLSACATINVPVTGCHSGALQAGLRKRRNIWPTDPPSTTPTVSSNAAARLIYHMSLFTGCASLSGSNISLAVMTYKVLHGTAPRYLGPLALVSDLLGRRTLRSANISRLLVPPVTLLSVAGLSPLLVPASGICYRRSLRQLSHCRHSASVSRLSSS